MNRKRIHPNLLITAIILLSGVAAFFLGRGTPIEKQSKEKAPAEFRNIIDHLNRNVRVKIPVKRIVSTHSSFSESLEFIGATDTIVAASNQEAGKFGVPSVETDEQLDIEKILLLKPDLVLVLKSHPEKVKELAAYLETKKVPLLALQPETLEESIDLVRLLSELTGKKNGKRLQENLFEQINRYEEEKK